MNDDINGDELDDLKALFGTASPAPNATRKAENLALAQKNFEMRQGSTDQPRSNPVAGPMGLWTGAKQMLNTLTSRAGLTFTTAIVACGVIVLTPFGQDMWKPSIPTNTPLTIAEAEEVTNLTRRTEPVADLIVPNDVAQVDLGNDQAVSDPLPQVAMEIHAEPIMAESQARTLSQEDALNMGGQFFSPSADVGALAAVDLETSHFSETAETYANADQNPLKVTATDPVSTFSIDVDTASYSLLRNSLSRGFLPDPDAVRVEELINYFPYDYPSGTLDDAPFRPTVNVFETPWNTDTQLVHIAIQGTMPAIEDRPPLNLVFLIDTSGSMNDPSKLPLLKQSFRLMLDNLHPDDEVAIVEYAGSAGQVLAPTAASDRQAILQAISSLGAGGSTNGQGGLEQAYAIAADMSQDGEVNRVILATDGDFNVGVSDPSGLENFIADKRDTGTYLSVLGFGRGNLNDATMQALAQNGNGQAAYIDTLNEAQKVLVDQLTGALFPIANDVKIQVEFNPAQIAEYRLIGYETRQLNREDFNNDAVDAGELGASHNVTAIYEVTPVGSPAQLTDPLRYQPTQTATDSDELGFLRLRYKTPGQDVSQLIETPILPGDVANTEQAFAVAMAGFGQLLRSNDYIDDWSYGDAIALANANRGDDPFGYRTEAVQLMRLAQSLSEQ
ncbi:von Willebrand factor type A domain-containing protein [Aestuariibius sp. HNIBRBA575]|uniref:vWA domain-containing protein n=1 Tax=Aestuariibius sp. HNIBRBA575 TaxID=3233343 RepID=UPI0034A255CB